MKAIVGSTVIIAAASIVLNVLLGAALFNAFAELQFTRIYPLGYADERGSPAAASTGHPLLALYGDSRIQMWDLGSLRPQYDVANLGHGGLTSRQLLLQLLSEPATRSQFAVLQVGINDIHPLGALPQQRAQILARLEENLRSIVATLRDRADVVVVSTVIPPGSVPLQRRLTWDQQSLGYIARVNDLLRGLCDGEHVVLLDAQQLLGKGDGWLQPAYADADFFLHINAAGYAVLNRELLRLLGAGGGRTAQPGGEALGDAIEASSAEVGATGESPAVHAFGA